MDLGPLLEQRGKVEEFTRKHRVGLLTLLFTDMVGSTQLKQELGDGKAVELIQRHHALVRSILTQANEAEEIETAGDSFFLVFAKPSDAVRFSLILQSQLRDLSRGTSRKLADRIGLHIGEVIIEERMDAAKSKDLYGLQVDLCARVTSLADGDQILMTRSAFDNARQVLKGEDIGGVTELTWLNHGSYVLKGVDEPIEVCEVGEKGRAVLRAPADSEKVRRYIPPDREPVLGWRPAIGLGVPGTGWILENKLGEGGFGEVWLCRNKTTKDQKVFKFCFRADRVRSLKREVTLFRVMKERLGTHPNIAGVLDVYLEEPPYYLTMEYGAGQDLKKWCEAQGGVAAIPLETRLEIVAQIADGLQAAHETGVIHRDVKPSNVLVRSETPSEVRVQLTDFGIGQVVSEEVLGGVTRLGFTETMISTGMTAPAGTHLYLAPELLGGKVASAQSDLYSLGVILYQLLIGDFSRPITTDWRREINDPLLQDDLGRCTASQPEKRFREARDLAIRLRSFGARQNAHRSEIEIDRAEDAFEAEDAQMAVAHLARALRLDSTNRIAATRLISALSQRVFPVPDGEPIQIDGFITDLQLGRDGRRVAICWAGSGKEGCARVWDIASGKACTEILRHDGRVQSVRLSPEGERVLTVSEDKTARIWRIGHRPSEPVTLRHRAEVSFGDFSPDGRWVVTASVDFGARVWDAETGEPITDWLRGKARRVCHAEFHPDGHRLLTTAEFESQDASVQVWEISSGRLLFGLASSPFASAAAHFSPDGTRFAMGFKDFTARIFDAGDGRPLTAPLRNSNEVICVQFSPESTRLLTVSKDYSARIWDAQTGELLVELRGAKSGSLNDGRPSWMTQNGSFSDNGLWVLLTDQRAVLVLDARTGQRLVEPIRLGGEAISAQFYLGGRSVLTASTDRQVQSWNLRLGEEILPFTDTKSRSGRYLPGNDELISVRLSEAVAFDIATGQPLTPAIGHPPGELISSLAASPNGERIVTIGAPSFASRASKETLRLWDSKTRSMIAEHKDESFERVIFSLDSQRFLTLGSAARIWNATSGQAVTESLPLSGHFSQHRFRAQGEFSPNGRYVLVTLSASQVKIWDAASGQFLRDLVHVEWVRSARFTPGSDWVMTYSGDRYLPILWKVFDEEVIRFDDPSMPFAALDFRRVGVTLNPDGRRVLILSDETFIWDFQNGQIVRLDGLRRPHSAVFTPDGAKLVTVTDQVVLWDVATGRSIGAPIEVPLGTRVELSSDGRRMVLNFRNSCSVRVLEFEKWALIGREIKHTAPVQTVRFGPNGDCFVTDDGAIRVFDSTTGRQLTEPFRVPEARGEFEISPECARLITGGSRCSVWDLPDVQVPLPDWLPEMAEAVAGLQVDSSGRHQAKGFSTLVALQKQLLESADADANTRWAKWFFSSGPERTISPKSLVTVQRQMEELERLGGIEKFKDGVPPGAENCLLLAGKMAKELMHYPVENPREAAQAEWLSLRAVEQLPANAYAWHLRASVLSAIKRHAEALEAIDRAIELEGKNRDFPWLRASILEALGQLDRAIANIPESVRQEPAEYGLGRDYAVWWLLKADRLGEACEALTKALEWVGSNASARSEILSTRYGILKTLNRLEEAAADNVERLGIPKRDSATPAGLIDLSLHYQESLDMNPAAAGLPRGVATLAGALFECRGVVGVGMHYFGHRPGLIVEPMDSKNHHIRIAQKCRRIHFLYFGTRLEREEDGTTLCKFVLRFAGGQSEDVRVILGRDILKPTATPDSLDPSVTVAWEPDGHDPGTAQACRAFAKVHDNPHPELTIDSLDFVLGEDLVDESAACFLVGITSE